MKLGLIFSALINNDDEVKSFKADANYSVTINGQPKSNAEIELGSNIELTFHSVSSFVKGYII